MLATVLSVALFAATGILAIPVVVFALQVFFATTRGSRNPTPMASHRPTVAVLVPAHEEAANVAATCEALQGQLTAADRLLVVADNCSDATAELARVAGAEVIERRSATQRGKGYALDFGVKHLAKAPREILIIVDADCTLIKGTMDHLARACAFAQRPVQAIYSMRNHPGASLNMRIAEFAGITKTLVRPLGYRALGLPCQLMGTGMAFPWPLVVDAKLATSHIVEDLKLGLEFACAGSAPLFCPEAAVVSYFPESIHGAKTQRTRWEHGHLSVILTDAPRLLATAVKRGNGTLFAMALDLAVPPLALLALLTAAVCAASLFLAIYSGRSGSLWAAGIVFVVLLSAVIVAWARFARSIVSAAELAFAPVYALLKVPIYLRFFYAKQAEWVRSARKGE